MRAILAVGALVAILAGACGNSPAVGGNSADAAVQDGAAADSAGQDAVSGADAATAADSGASSDTAADAAGDSAGGDAKFGDGNDGQTDAAGSLDAAKDGAASDVGPPDVIQVDGKDASGDATTGPYTCESACANIAKANCPSDDPVADCVVECGQFTGQAPPKCSAPVQELLKCISTAIITCKDGGKSDSSVCNYMEGELEKCFDGGPPPNPDPCPAGNCYGGAGPNGVESCGCDTTCYGSQIKLDCSGGKCACSVDGKVTANFDDATVCSMNPWETLKSACGLPTGP